MTQEFFFYFSLAEATSVTHAKTVSIEDDVESPWESCIYICCSQCTFWQPVWAADSRHFWKSGCKDVKKKQHQQQQQKLEILQFMEF